jgi:hypothetical protein
MSSTDPPSKTKNDRQHGSPSHNKKAMNNTIPLPKQKTISNTDPPPKAKNDEQHGSLSQNKKR